MSAQDELSFALEEAESAIIRFAENLKAATAAAVESREEEERTTERAGGAGATSGGAGLFGGLAGPLGVLAAGAIGLGANALGRSLQNGGSFSDSVAAGIGQFSTRIPGRGDRFDPQNQAAEAVAGLLGQGAFAGAKFTDKEIGEYFDFFQQGFTQQRALTRQVNTERDARVGRETERDAIDLLGRAQRVVDQIEGIVRSLGGR